MLDVPAVGFPACTGIIAEGQLGITFDRDVIVVVESNQLTEPGVTREGRGLVGHPFHHVAIAGDEIHVMVVNLLVPVEYRGHVRLADGHAHCVADALTKGTGRRFHAGGVAVLWMPRRLALPLTELLQIVECEIIAGEVQHAVQKHRRVSGGQHEAIAIQPVRVGGVVAQVLGPKHIRKRRERHWSTRVARVGLLDGVHGQNSDRIDAEILERLARSF